MKSVSLAPFTTFHIGGPARVFMSAHAEEDIHVAIARACEQHLPLYPLGAGSNLLVPDAGVDGVVLKMAIPGIAVEERGDEALLIAGAGMPWEKVVDTASACGVYGIENLAGIPGTMGGAVVQNIGAYGTELASVFEYAEVINTVTGDRARIDRATAAFGYRTSFFKHRRELVIVRAALHLSKNALPNLTYPDLARAQADGTALSTSAEIARAVRVIRSRKFPEAKEEGTAGSFFKNPYVARDLADSLAARFPGLPLFPQNDGAVKIPLAWMLDHILSLKGFSKGPVRLYEKHSLIIVARAGATAAHVDAFAREVAARVFSVTGITIEREVETFGTRK